MYHICITFHFPHAYCCFNTSALGAFDINFTFCKHLHNMSMDYECNIICVLNVLTVGHVCKAHFSLDKYQVWIISNISSLLVEPQHHKNYPTICMSDHVRHSNTLSAPFFITKLCRLNVSDTAIDYFSDQSLGSTVLYFEQVFFSDQTGMHFKRQDISLKTACQFSFQQMPPLDLFYFCQDFTFHVYW